MSPAGYSLPDLLEEIARRGHRRCRCGVRRLDFLARQRGFYDRHGCLTCDTWDGAPVLDGSPL